MSLYLPSLALSIVTIHYIHTTHCTLLHFTGRRRGAAVRTGPGAVHLRHPHHPRDVLAAAIRVPGESPVIGAVFGAVLHVWWSQETPWSFYCVVPCELSVNLTKQVSHFLTSPLHLLHNTAAGAGADAVPGPVQDVLAPRAPLQGRGRAPARVQQEGACRLVCVVVCSWCVVLCMWCGAVCTAVQFGVKFAGC